MRLAALFALPGCWRARLSDSLQARADSRARRARAWDGVWSRIFADSPLPRQRSLALQHVTVAALSGLASTSMLQGERAPTPKPQLELLKRMLARELRGPSWARSDDEEACKLGLRS